MFILQWVQQILSGIQTFFATLGAIFLQSIGLAKPAAGVRRFPAWLLWLVEALFVLLLLAALFLVNRAYQQHIQGLPAGVRRIFFPLVGLLGYAIFRLVIFIIRQLPSRGPSFPDIDEAIARGLQAVFEARINLNDTPLFLAVGLTKEAEGQFAKLGFVQGELCVNEDRLPVHWYGGRNGIWVTLPGVSAIVEQATRPPSAPASVAPRVGAAPVEYGGGATLLGGDIPPQVLAAAAAGGTMSGLPGPAAAPAQFATMAGGAVAASPGATMVGATAPAVQVAGDAKLLLLPPRLSADEKDLCQARLEYFVTRVCELRYPVCPVNSVIVFLPYEWITSPEHAMLSDAATADMRALQDRLGVKCTCVAVLNEIEKSDGFKELVNRYDRKAWDEQRLGCGFPVLCFLNPEELGNIHDWQLKSFEQLIYPHLQKRMGDVGNRKIVRFLDEFRHSKMGFAKVLGNTFPRDVVQPFYFGGVYFAGASHNGKAPFLQGVLAKVMADHEETIAWSPESIEQDRQYVWWMRVVMVVMAAVVIVDAALIVKLVNRWLE
jgi:hypothetical protein